jgi:hypothetical protein
VLKAAAKAIACWLLYKRYGRADEANPWKWTNVGIALFEIGSAGTWLVLIIGENTWEDYNNGDTRPGWMTTPPYNPDRPYLSETVPGQYATSEPYFKVFAGRSGSSYTPADPPSPEVTSFSAVAVGQGSVYPIPPSGGGTGTNLEDLDENMVIAVKTVSGKKKLFGYLNAAAELQPVVTLVTEEAGFVAVLKVDVIADAVLADADAFRAGDAGLGHVSDADALHEADVGIDTDDLVVGAELAVEHGQPAADAPPGSEIGDVDGEGVVVAIDDEAAEAVCIGVDDAVGVGVGIDLESVFPQAEGAKEEGVQLGLAKVLRAVMEDAEGDAGLGVQIPGTKRLAFFVVDVHEVSGACV